MKNETLKVKNKKITGENRGASPVFNVLYPVLILQLEFLLLSG